MFFFYIATRALFFLLFSLLLLVLTRYRSAAAVDSCALLAPRTSPFPISSWACNVLVFTDLRTACED